MVRPVGGTVSGCDSAAGTMWSAFPAAPLLFQHSGIPAGVMYLGCITLESVGRCPAVILLRSAEPLATANGTEACGAVWPWH